MVDWWEQEGKEQLECLTEQRLREAFAAAVRDPQFLEDVEATTRAFAVSDGAVAGAVEE